MNRSSMRVRPTIVAISGFSSNVGKTTLVCELLRHLAGWEAIKLTRGHYRSCGRDPAGCCVSDLLRDEPVIRSSRKANYQVGKDTGHFWDAGASNVHWVIVKDDQVAQGITQALARVEADGVIVEGNSFLEYVDADLTIMCARSQGGTIKSSARSVLSKVDFLYLSTLEATAGNAKSQFAQFRAGLNFPIDLDQLATITHDDLPTVLSRIHGAKEGRALNLPQSSPRPSDSRKVSESFIRDWAGPLLEFDSSQRRRRSMPEKETLERAEEDKKEGKAPSTQAGEFVREEIEHVREGKHGARSTKQAIAIGLSKARRAGVKLKPPKKGSKETRKQAARDLKKGKKRTAKKSAKRSRATSRALKREGRSAASKRALSRQARSAAKKRSAASRSRSAKKAAKTRKK